MYLNIDNKITEGNRIIKLSVPNLSYVEFPFTIDQLEERYLFSNIVVSADFGNRLFIFFTYDGHVAAFNIEGEKLCIGNYSNGLKQGKWHFLLTNNIQTVDYINSKIISVENTYSNDIAGLD